MLCHSEQATLGAWRNLLIRNIEVKTKRFLTFIRNDKQIKRFLPLVEMTGKISPFATVSFEIATGASFNKINSSFITKTHSFFSLIILLKPNFSCKFFKINSNIKKYTKIYYARIINFRIFGYSNEKVI